MKRMLSLFCLGVLLFFSASTQGSTPHVTAEVNPLLGQVDLILQTDGSPQRLVDQIMKSGGTIKYTYQNAPVIAATVPTSAFKEIYNHPDVVKVSKDHLLTLLDGGTAEGYPRSNEFEIQGAVELSIQSIDPSSLEPGSIPLGYGSFLFSRAHEIWKHGQYGSGSVVAVVDSGTVPEPCLEHAVIGAPGHPQGFNATDDKIPATDPKNLRHGTHVAGVIASACGIDFSSEPENPLYLAVSANLPTLGYQVPVWGQAPLAQIYPVKVFDTSGEGSPTSTILDALDHLLDLKKSGDLDIDVVNLSFGGPTGNDGRSILDTFLEQFREQGILVVAAAGNNGPLPNSLASPATSYASIAVGALDYAPTTRVMYEYLGLTQQGKEGQGLVMRPTDELRVADFSGRGPMSDGRFGPDLVAPGMWSFQFGPPDGFQWHSGTSFAAASVSGAAALLNAYYETETGQDTPWLLWRNSLLLGADLSVIGGDWQDINTAGFGALNAAKSMEIFKSGEAYLEDPNRSEHLRANILGNPMSGDQQIFEQQVNDLFPSQSFNMVFDISPSTSKVTLRVSEISAPDNSGEAIWANSLKILVQSSKRSAIDPPIDNYYWYPHRDGDEFSIEIEDGLWSLNENSLADQQLEPGLMKVSLVSDYANQHPLSFKVQLTRDQDRDRDAIKPIAQGTINMGEVISIPLEIPAGTGRATLDLVWNRDWLKFPTSDMDLVIYDQDGQPMTLDGVSWDAPERVVIDDPPAGILWVQVEAREIYKTDLFRLYLHTETASDTDEFDIISQQPETGTNTGTGDDTASTHIIWLPIIP